MPQGFTSRQPDGLVGLVVLSYSLFEMCGDLDRLRRPPSFLRLESRLVEVFVRCAPKAFRAPVARLCFISAQVLASRTSPQQAFTQ